MGHSAVSATQASSVTLKIWQHGDKENYCKFVSFNREVDTKTSKFQMGPNISHVGKKINLNQNIFSDFSEYTRGLKGPKGKYNLHYG